MSRTSKSASRCPVNDEQPSHGEQELDDQLTQEELVEDEDPVGEP
jgi:hypothetical protein